MKLSLGLALVAAGLLAGCASGPTLSESKSAPIAKGMSRLVVYRTGLLGAAIQPKVQVDGKDTGLCTPNGVFSVDVPAGQHRVSATTEMTNQTVVETKAGATSYVKCSVGFGLVIGQARLEGVSTATGAAETGGLSLTGSY